MALVVGTVRKTADGIVVEARLMRVMNGAMTLGKQYSGSAKSLADGGRVFAHGIADEIHKQQRNLRGVARTKLAFSSDRDGARMKGPVGDRDVSNIYHVRLRRRQPVTADGQPLDRHRARLVARRRAAGVHLV